MIRLQTFSYALKLREPFVISHGTRIEQPTLLVKLTEGQHSGWGEAAAISYYHQTPESIAAALEKVKPLLTNAEGKTAEQLWEFAASMLAENSFALSALDIALHDLRGRQKGEPLHRSWGLNAAEAPLSNFTFGIGTPKEVLAKMKKRPWPVYKIKLGGADDLGVMKLLCQNSDAKFRVDANAGWNLSHALHMADELHKLKQVELIEQPMSPTAPAAEQRELFEKSALPLMADESCQTEADVAKCAEFFHGVNIKLPKCGGITPARRMIEHATKLGLHRMIGCMTEGSVGISGIAQLAPLLDFVDLDGYLLVSNDPASGATLEQGRVELPQRPGTGVIVDEEQLQRGA
jgi:L-alanine-DL-glutamate epimerase-like enolase superfamily enzyme